MVDCCFYSPVFACLELHLPGHVTLIIDSIKESSLSVACIAAATVNRQLGSISSILGYSS